MSPKFKFRYVMNWDVIVEAQSPEAIAFTEWIAEYEELMRVLCFQAKWFLPVITRACDGLLFMRLRNVDDAVIRTTFHLTTHNVTTCSFICKPEPFICGNFVKWAVVKWFVDRVP